MRLSTLGRFLGALCLAGSVTYVAGAPASASTPNWHMTAVPDPGVVKSGAVVAYTVHIWNEGPSNISTLFLTTSTKDVPVYLVNDQNGFPACASGTTAQLNCAFGELGPSGPDGGITITVGYKTSGTTSYNPGFLASTTGNTVTDKHHTSHGDTLGPENPDAVTGLRTDKDFAGGFSLNTDPVGTDNSLGRSNAQSTAVTPPQAHIPVTTEDGSGLTIPFSCDSNAYCQGKTPFGEWSKVNVDGGLPQTTFFPITIMVYGKSVPNTVTQDSIALIHTDDLGNPIGDGPLQQCAPDAAHENCIQVTKVGSNWKIVAWVEQNGGFKGMG